MSQSLALGPRKEGKSKRVSITTICYGSGIPFHVTWSRALARLAQAVWSGRTRYLYTNRTL
jgi:hypothetical protein